MTDRLTSVNDLFDLPSWVRDRLAWRKGQVIVDRSLGDGITDATAALQSAINKAGTWGGGTVLIPPGTFMKAAALTIPSGVTIQGSGRSSVVKNFDAAGQPVFAIGSGVAGVTIRDLHADGAYKTGHTVAFSTIFAEGARNCTFHNLEVSGGTRLYAFPHPESGRGEGIEWAHGADGATISDCYVHDVDYGGVKVRGAKNVTITNLRAHNCGGQGMQFSSGLGVPSVGVVAVGVVVTHDSGVPGTGSLGTSAATFHDTYNCSISGMYATGIRVGMGDAGINTNARLMNSTILSRESVGTLPSQCSFVTYGPFSSGGDDVTTIVSKVGKRVLYLDGRGFVYDNNGAPTVLATP